MSILVLKFGGTSVAAVELIESAAKIVKSGKDEFTEVFIKNTAKKDNKKYLKVIFNIKSRTVILRPDQDTKHL